MASTLVSDHGPVKRELGAFRAVKMSRVQCNGGRKRGMGKGREDDTGGKRTASYQQTEKPERSLKTNVCGLSKVQGGAAEFVAMSIVNNTRRHGSHTVAA